MVLTNIFRLDGYEQLRWTVLEKESAGSQSNATEALDSVLHAFLKLHNLGHLTAWTVRRDSESKDGGAHEQTCPLQLWHFRPPSAMPDQVLKKDLLGLLPGFRAVDSGTWTPQSRQPGVTHAVSLAIRKKVERALGTLSYHPFGRVYIRVGGRDTAPEGPLLACEVRLLGSPASLFLQAHISKRNVRLLEPSDFNGRQPLSVVCSPSGERASLLGACPSELVARLSQPSTPPEPSSLPAATNPAVNPQKIHRAKVRRRKRGSLSGSPALHVEVEVEAISERVAGAGELIGQQTAKPSADVHSVEDTGNEVEEHRDQEGRNQSDALPEGTADARTEGTSLTSPSKLKCGGGKEHSDTFDASGRRSEGRDPDGRTLKSRERLILRRERVLVPLPDFGRCAAQLRFRMGLEGFGVTGTGEGLGASGGLGGSGTPTLAGWPTTVDHEKSEDDRSSNESDSSSDTDAADEAAQGESQEAGVSSEVAGHKRDRPEDLGAVNAPPRKVRKIEEAADESKLFGPSDEEAPPGGGHTWWADDGLDVGLLADFADFGDAFGDSCGFGEMPGSSPKSTSREGSQPVSAHIYKSSGGPLIGVQAALCTASQDKTPSSATVTETDPDEPFGVLFDEFLSRPAQTASRSDDKSVDLAKVPPLRSKGGSAEGKAFGGVEAEGDDRAWLPPECWAAAKVSLPARSETSDGNMIRAVYKPEGKTAEFVRAVLGQGSSRVYEALPPVTPGLVDQAGQEVHLRGTYPKVRKVRKGEPRLGEQAEGEVEKRERDASAQPRAEADERGLQTDSEERGPAEKSDTPGRSGHRTWKQPSTVPPIQGTCNSVLATDLLLLRREAAKLIGAQGQSSTATGADLPGAEAGAAETSGESNRGMGSSGSGDDTVLGPEPLLQMLEEGVSSESLQKSEGDWDVRKRPPLSPLLLQQAITGRSDFRNGPLEEAVQGTELGAGSVSAATVARVLTGDVSAALRDAFKKETVSGPLTVEELCVGTHSGGSASGATQPPAMQIGSPAIEHPVTPPQLWAITLNKPLGGVGGAFKSTPPSENVDTTSPELAQSDLARLRDLAPPPVLVGYQEDWLRVPQGVLKQWEKAPLEPYSAPKAVSYTAFCPASADLIPLCVRYLKEVGSVYEACQLGSHVATSLPSDLATPSAPGIVPVILESDRMAGNDRQGDSTAMASVEMFVEGIRTSAIRLGFGGEKRREGTEGNDDPCTVVYVVLPLCTEEQARSVTAQLTSFFWAAERGKSTVPTISTSAPHRPLSLADTRLTLQLLPESELRSTWYRPGATDRLKQVAFEVYLKARRINRKLPRGAGLQELPPSQMYGETEEGPSGFGSGHLLFEPLIVLADPPAFCPVILTGQSEEREVGELEAGEHAPESGVPLHCCYAWAHEGRTLVSVWTDGAGELLDAYVISDDSHHEGDDLPLGARHFGTAFHAENKNGLSLLGVGQRAKSRTPEHTIRPADCSSSYLHRRSEALLDGILEQCAQLRALAAAVTPEGEPPPPCHVTISRLGGMPWSESLAWSRLLGSLRQHDASRGLIQVLPTADPATQSVPSVAHPGLGNLSSRGAGLRNGRTFSLELGGDPLELERFGSLEQQCLSPASPGLAFSPFGARPGGVTDRAFSSPPDRTREEPRGSVASITIVAVEKEPSCQLLHGADDRQSRESNLMSVNISSRALPQSRNDHLIIPANPLHRLAECGEPREGPDELLANSVACGYLVGDVAPANDDVSFGTSAAKDDWPVTLRFDLISHSATSGDNVNMNALQEAGPQAIILLESIIEAFHALSWLDANHGDCRRSLLPVHAAMAEEMVKSIGG